MRYASPIPPTKKKEADGMIGFWGHTGKGRTAGKSGFSTLRTLPGSH